MFSDFDIVIVGGGGSGLAAAARGAELGLRVVVLEKQPQLGGTTGIAVGSFTANRTSYQQSAGIEDSIDDHAEDAGRFANPEIEARNDDALRRFFLSYTAETLQWLTQMGLNFHGPSPEPPNRVPRMHNVVPNAKAYIAALQAKILRHGGTIHCDAGVSELLYEGDRVVGVKAKIASEDVRFEAARGVILAAGDYANSPAMIGRFKGEQFTEIEGINPNATGDGHCLAEQAGAKLVNMDVTYGPELRFVAPPSRRISFTQLLPATGLWAKALGRLMPFVPKRIIQSFIKRLLVTWQHPENALFDDGAILVNQNGERFCDERIWPDREIAVARQPGKVAYILLDQQLIGRYSEWPHFISTAPEIAYAYVEDYLRLRSDVALAAESLPPLASLRSIPTESMMETVAAVNRQRNDASLAPLSGSRWVMLGPVRAYFTTTEGGAAINQRFEVLNEQEQPIPGLYAIGQNGLGGQILWGHGLHIAWAITSGRLVAEYLANESLSPKRRPD